jgi:hypothetical protein
MGEGRMDDRSQGNQGLQKLIEKFRHEFERPENTNFYSETDYRDAERKYIKHRLRVGTDG